ncbi:MAG: FtsX-like permease family protein [Muribaculaceae bacterium]|nr:FtsX-like permease family protein [Muribaculaceae bacterium]
MKRALISQISHEWKENLWLVIELLIVAVVIWTLSLFIIRTIRNYNYPRGFDEEGVYYADVLHSDTDGNDWLKRFRSGECSEEEIDRHLQDQKALLEQIRALSMVESAAFGGNAMPYNYNFYGNDIQLISNKNDTIQVFCNERFMTPECAKVLRLHSVNGLTTDQLADVLRNNQLIVGQSAMTINDGLNLKEQAGRPAISSRYETDFTIGAVIDGIQRNRYEIFIPATVIYPVTEGSAEILWHNTLLLRLRPGTEKEFERTIEENPALLRYRDAYIDSMQSLASDGVARHWRSDVRQRTIIAGVLLLLFIVFLGLLGTFWFRVYVRTSEIAVRKSFGATDADILRRFLSEAMLLLSTAFIPAVAIVIYGVRRLADSYFGEITYFKGWGWDMALGGLLTFAVMALMILIGVGIPARRAMKIQPAIALKEE